MTDANVLLDRLLALHWLGGVSLGKAAQLVGIRNADFAELADLRFGERALERVALRYFAHAFHRQFPECSPTACRHAQYAARKRLPCSHSRKPTRREVELMTPPQRQTMREVVPGPRKPDADVARYLAAHPIPLYRKFPDPPETGTENELPAVKYP